VEQALANKTIASTSCLSSRPPRRFRLWSATRDRREDAHRLAILQNPLFSPTRRSRHLLAVDQYHLNLRVGNLEPIDQVRQTCAVVEVDFPFPAVAAWKAISKIREQAHVDPHRRRYAGFPANSVS
jgi:hypothetical protein